MPMPPEGDQKPKYDLRFPEGIGSWRKKPFDINARLAPGEMDKLKGSQDTPVEGAENQDFPHADTFAPGAEYLEYMAAYQRWMRGVPGSRRPELFISFFGDAGLPVVPDSKQEASSAVTSKRLARPINEVQPAEVEEYLAVPLWRIWQRSNLTWDGEYIKAFNQAAAKPLALICRERHGGYSTLFHRESTAKGTPHMPLFSCGFDMPYFLLEPLAEEDIDRIKEEVEAHELLNPAELKEFFEPPQPPRVEPRGHWL